MSNSRKKQQLTQSERLEKEFNRNKKSTIRAYLNLITFGHYKYLDKKGTNGRRLGFVVGIILSLIGLFIIGVPIIGILLRNMVFDIFRIPFAVKKYNEKLKDDLEFKYGVNQW